MSSTLLSASVLPLNVETIASSDYGYPHATTREAGMKLQCTVLLLSWLLASCGDFNWGKDKDTQLFQPFQGDRAIPGCQLKDYASFAKEVQCFTISREDLRRVLFIDVQNPKARVRLFPSTVAGDELSIRKELATPSKTNSPSFAFSWAGSVFSDAKPQQKIGTALLSVREGSVVGRITAGSDVFEIRPLGGGIHVAIKVDEKKKLPMHPPESLEREKAGVSHDPAYMGGLPLHSARENYHRTASVTNLAESRDGAIAVAEAAMECKEPGRLADDRKAIPTVTVAIAFEQNSRPSPGDFAALGEAYIDFTNAALEYSRVGLNVALPASVDSIREVGNFVQGRATLDEIASGSSSSRDEIRRLLEWRERIRADLVVIVTNNFGACGSVRQVKIDQPNRGFALVNPICAIVELQVAHEVGHLLGGDHNPEMGISPRSDPDARGYILQALNRQTIMAESNITKEPYFSNPEVCWDSINPMGSLGANNARAMSDHAPVVSRFFP